MRSGGLEPLEERAEITVGMVLDGRYLMAGELGHGGMGRVFEATDRKLGRKVAIKFISVSRDDALARHRFLREAKAACSINHPNVLSLIDTGAHGDLPYIVTELLEGETIHQHLLRSPPPPRLAIEWGIQIARGLSAAHAKQIVHRDLKPANLFVTTDGFVKILDFGIAKLLEEPFGGTASEEGNGPATEAGRAVGTIGYMAPEQMRAGPVDHRADLFAFGAVLYELLSGRSAFRRATSFATGYACMHEEPPPLGPEVQEELRSLVQRCLIKDPALRIASAHEIAEVLNGLRLLTPTAPIASAPPAANPAPRSRSSSTKARLLIALALGACVAAASAFYRLQPRAAAGDDRPTVLVTSSFGPGTPQADELAGTASARLSQFLLSLASVRVEREATLADGSAAGARRPDWILQGSSVRTGDSMRLVFQFESAPGRPLGEPFAIEGPAKELPGRLRELQRPMLDELSLLVRDRNRRAWARAGTSDAQALALLESYYELMGFDPRAEFFARGKMLLDAALALDARYVPALVERARLLRIGARGLAEGPRASLAAARRDADAAANVAPSDDKVLAERCQIAKEQLLEQPSDAEIESALAACSAAVHANSASVPSLFALASLQDQSCQHDLTIATLHRALAAGQRFDRSWEGLLRMRLVSLALLHHRLEDADAMIDDLLELEREEDRLGPRALSRRTGPGPVAGVHLMRAAVLLRRGQNAEAEQELRRELARGKSGGLPDWAEAGSLQGLARLAHNRGQAVPAEQTNRLRELEAQFKTREGTSSSNSTLGGAYRLVDLGAAVNWMRKVKTDQTCHVSFMRAVILREAGLLDEARRAVHACTSTDRWVERCKHTLLYDVSDESARSR